MLIRKQFKFEAAHVLPHHPGKCARLHGHSYRLDVALDGPLQEVGPARGMIEDFDVVTSAVHETVIDKLDHRSLNELIDNPTAERIVLWIWQRLSPRVSGLAELTLWETQTACAIVQRGDALTTAHMNLDAATR